MQKRAVARSREHTKEIKKKKKAQLLKLPPVDYDRYTTSFFKYSRYGRGTRQWKREMFENFKASQGFKVQSFISLSPLAICKSMQCVCMCVRLCAPSHKRVSVCRKSKDCAGSLHFIYSLRMLKVVTENRNIETWQAVIHIGTLPAQLSSR